MREYAAIVTPAHLGALDRQFSPVHRLQQKKEVQAQVSITKNQSRLKIPGTGISEAKIN